MKTDENGNYNIWSTNIPYNTGESKLDVMNVTNENVPLGIATAAFIAQAMKPRMDFDSLNEIDNCTYAVELKTEKSSLLFSDEPYLIPYLVKGSDKAVIIVPGGGLAYKSCDTSPKESADVAELLNNNGISAFVLRYRLNPYRMPVPALDLQRAIRFVRYNAKRFGINKKKIGIIGFSAGGFICAYQINKLRNSPVRYEGYKNDAIDKESADVKFAGLVYPVLTAKSCPIMLLTGYGKDNVDTPDKKRRCIKDMELIKNVYKKAPPQFLCYGEVDVLINPKYLKIYKKELDKKNIPNLIVEVSNTIHGFGASEGEKFENWESDFVVFAKFLFDA